MSHNVTPGSGTSQASKEATGKGGPAVLQVVTKKWKEAPQAHKDKCGMQRSLVPPQTCSIFADCLLHHYKSKCEGILVRTRCWCSAGFTGSLQAA